MQTQFVKEGMNNYLMTNEIQCDEDDYDYNLFRNQNVPFFMPCETREVNGMVKIYYKLTYRTSLKQAFGHVTFTPEKINNIMRSIVGVLETCEEYLLSADNIICSADNVFMDINTGKLVFGYCFDDEKEYSLKDLVMEILQNIDRRHEKGAILLLQFYNLLTESDCSIEKLKKITIYGDNVADDNTEDSAEEYTYITDDYKKKEIKKEKKEILSKGIKLLMAFVSIVDIMLLIGLVFNMLTYEKTGFLFVGMAVLIILVIIYMQVEPEESPEEIMKSFKESEQRMCEDENLYTQVNDNIDKETVLLTDDNSFSTQLIEEDKPGKIYLNPMERDKYSSIIVDDDNIVIGSMAGNCDQVISAKGVSRLHAKISGKNDGIYIMDMNSTNGTYLNGELLVPGKEYRLELGDMVSFAKVQYIICDENIQESVTRGPRLVKEEFPA